jgi:amidase
MEELSAPEIQSRMDRGELTARALVERFLERIEGIDWAGPSLNSVLELNPEARAIAGALDAEREAKGPRGPLHGVPLIIKGNIDTADQMTTTAGSLALEGSRPAQDAFLVGRLRQAGAVILGKANLSEWANFRSTHSTSGWSSQGGQTRNPHVLDRNPCGSSSGSAVAVAANLCTGAVGTETDGSVVCPSHANGIVGIKPTLGLISRAGIIPVAHSQDTAGPMARTVADAAVMLGAMRGLDPRDPVTKYAQTASQVDYGQFLDPEGLKGARIGLARNFFGHDSRVDAIIEHAVEHMSHLGAAIVDPADIVTAGDFKEAETEVLLYEFKADLNSYLAGLGRGAPVGSLAEVIAFNEAHADRVLPYFGQERMLAAQQKGPLSSRAYMEARGECLRLARDEGIDATLRKHELDAIVAATISPAWLTDLVSGDHHKGASYSPAAVAGYPNITVPAGTVVGLPVGISFFGGAFQEPTLIKLAYAFEQATMARVTPQFRPSVDLTHPQYEAPSQRELEALIEKDESLHGRGTGVTL